MISDYVRDLVSAMRGRHPWDLMQLYRFFPERPARVYQLVRDAGFSPEAYRKAWPDLESKLADDSWSVKHYVQFLESEVGSPRRFPIDIQFDAFDAFKGLRALRKRWVASVVRNLIQGQIDFTPERVADPTFWTKTLRAVGQFGTPVVAFGDSHSRVFRQTIQGDGELIIPLNVLCGGGSASGLPNQASRSGYGALIRAAAEAIETGKQRAGSTCPILFTFGQVDMEFVETYRRLKSGRFDYDQPDFARFSADLAASYVEWLASLPMTGCVVVGINPPCLDDRHLRDAYLIQMQTYLHAGLVQDQDPFGDFPKLTFPDQLTRTRNHAFFNESLAAAARARGLTYIDSFATLLDASGCIAPKYARAFDGTTSKVGNTGKDIHIGGDFALAVQARLLRDLIRAQPAL